MSARGQAVASLALPASTHGEIAVEEYGYGLGPPTGMLVLRYPAGPSIPDYPQNRDDFLHQLFWSPDGVLCLRRGDTARYASSREMLWIRRGVVAEVHGVGSQTVLRACFRLAPPNLTGMGAAVLAPSGLVGDTLLDVARAGVSEEEGLRARTMVLEELAATPAVEVDHGIAAASPAHHVSRALHRDTADTTSLNDWAAQLHISAKTLQRDFERAFAMTFSAWRTRIRMRAASAMLVDLSVTETAHRVGYSSASAFVAAFTREFGTTPGRFREPATLAARASNS